MKNKNQSYNKLKTPWFSEGKVDIPWNVYPRPQLKRDSFLCLNGGWDFKISSTDVLPSEYGKSITVPFPPESELSGIEATPSDKEYLYYRKHFSLPEGFKRDRVILHFGAVDGICDVYVNGTLLKHNECGYLPFSIDVTESLTEGENKLEVRVKDDTSPIHPYGKQRKKRGGMWYTPISGIWQTVWLESVNDNYISSIKITQTDTYARIKITGAVGTKRLTLAESGEVFEFDGDEVTVTPKSKRLWTTDTPFLYYFTISTENDEIESYFALRSVEICDTPPGKCLFLNKKPYLFNGLLDQGYFPDGIFLPASYKGYEDDILRAKELGFNMLRKHIKIEPMTFYHLCDKLGMIVFQDAVNNGKYSFIKDTALPTVGFKKRNDKRMHADKKTRECFLECADGMIDMLYSTPSVLYYTIFNEGWGQFTADEIYDRFKSKDETRIIDSTSGWFRQNKSDVDSHHVYFKKIKADLCDRPLVVSEYGGYSYRIEDNCFSGKNYGYACYDSKEAFEKAITELFENEVIPLARKGACAFVYTQLSDVEDETNGFLTYDRREIKITPAVMKGITERLTDEFLKATEKEGYKE